MVSRIQYLTEKEIANPPKWLPDNVVYETLMGSVAYQVNTDDSDEDIYGICIPKKEDLFVHLKGLVEGFDDIQRFEQYQEHGLNKNNRLGNKKIYDFSIFSITKYFRLLSDNNPNCIDAVFTPRNCITYTNQVGEMIRDNRKLFLHKGSWYKLKGYAYSQLHKGRNAKEEVKDIRALEDELNLSHSTTYEEAFELSKDIKYSKYFSMYTKGMNKSKRFQDRKIKNMDSKFMYHVVRLLYAGEMILVEGDYDPTRHKEHLKAIRRGDLSEEEIIKWAANKEADLEKVYVESKLRHSPDITSIRELLLNCLEHHYGNLEVVERPDKYKTAFLKIKDLVESV